VEATMKIDWQRMVTVTLAVLSLGMGGALAYDKLAGDCCKPGAACCVPGSPCCHEHAERPEG
jgi:hypothetical protein